MQPPQDRKQLDTARQVDEICDRFESNWLADKHPRVEDFVSAAPETVQAAVFRALLIRELKLLGNAGKAPVEADYQKTFPAQANVISGIFKEAIAKMVGKNAPSVSGAGARTASFHTPEVTARFRQCAGDPRPNRPIQNSWRVGPRGVWSGVQGT